MEDKTERSVQSLRQLAAVLAALLCLTGLTIAASRLYTGPLRVAVALSIASAKSVLVLLFFMHMRRAGKVVAVAFLVTLLTLATFIGLTFFDILYR